MFVHGVSGRFTPIWVVPQENQLLSHVLGQEFFAFAPYKTM